jgi:hypothetical protein
MRTENFKVIYGCVKEGGNHEFLRTQTGRNKKQCSGKQRKAKMRPDWRQH